MKKVILVIDTSSNEWIKVGLRIDENNYILKKKITSRKAQVVLPMIQRLLKKHNLELQDLTAINVNAGPGSFTGLRVGISIANALSFALGIPVNGQKNEKIAEPVYQ